MRRMHARRLQAAIVLQRAWPHYLERRKQQKLREDRIASVSLARQYVAAHTFRAALRIDAARRIQQAWRAAALRLAAAAICLQRTLRGVLVRRELEACGVLISSSTQTGSVNAEIRLEARRCMLRHGCRTLKAADWELVATRDESSNACRRTALRVSASEASSRAQLRIASSTFPLALATMAHDLLRSLEVMENAEELSLKLQEVVQEQAEPEPEFPDDPEPKQSSMDRTLLPNASAAIADTSLPWTCSSCGFKNEVSPTLCVLCDSDRSKTTAPSRPTSAKRPPLPSAKRSSRNQGACAAINA